MSKERLNKRLSVLQSFSEAHGLSQQDCMDDITEEDDNFRFIDEVVAEMVKDQQEQDDLHNIIESAMDP